jgi:hypothetical protein
MNLTVNEIYSFKLFSGEEVITKVVGFFNDYYLISDPVSVAPGPQGIGLMPSMFTADTKENIRLNTNSIAIIAETEDAVKTKYIEATTGIKVPSKKLILG